MQDLDIYPGIARCSGPESLESREIITEEPLKFQCNGECYAGDFPVAVCVCRVCACPRYLRLHLEPHCFFDFEFFIKLFGFNF